MLATHTWPRGSRGGQVDVAECDTKLAPYRAALEAGTDPALVAAWTTQVQADRAAALGPARKPSAAQRMSPEEIREIREIREIIDALGSVHTVLAGADPDDKSDVYQRLGLRLAYRLDDARFESR